jgi:hypothetical protein
VKGFDQETTRGINGGGKDAITIPVVDRVYSVHGLLGLGMVFSLIAVLVLGKLIV